MNDTFDKMMKKALETSKTIVVDGVQYNLLDVVEWDLNEANNDEITLYFPDDSITFSIGDDLSAEDETKILEFMDTM